MQRFQRARPDTRRVDGAAGAFGVVALSIFSWTRWAMFKDQFKYVTLQV